MKQILTKTGVMEVLLKQIVNCIEMSCSNNSIYRGKNCNLTQIKVKGQASVRSLYLLARVITNKYGSGSVAG